VTQKANQITRMAMHSDAKGNINASTSEEKDVIYTTRVYR